LLSLAIAGYRWLSGYAWSEERPSRTPEDKRAHAMVTTFVDAAADGNIRRHDEPSAEWLN
jgi:hypothetical protein